jgi:hypothetical protein
MVSIDRPRLYATTLRNQPPGALLDLPLGLRDGFGERGHLDHRALFYQTLHQHPIAGGFVARLSPRIVEAYATDPVLGTLLFGRAPASGQSLACTFRYLTIPTSATPGTREEIARVFTLERLDGDEARELFRITGCEVKPIVIRLADVDPADCRSCR